MVLHSARKVVWVALAICVCACSISSAVEARKVLTPSELVAVVKSGADVEIRQDAIAKLGDITEADERNLQVSELLIDIVKMSPNPFLAKQAIKTLTKLQMNVSTRPKTKYMPDFILLLKNPRALPGVRTGIAVCFRDTLKPDELKDREAVVTLKAIAQAKGEPLIALRAYCIEAIGNMGDPDNIGMLCEILADPDPYIKEAAARAIVLMLDKAPISGQNVSLAAINKIVEMVNDEKLGVDLRVVVIRADALLMAAGTPGANKGLDTIIKLVKNAPEDKLVLVSIEALGIVGTVQAAEPLIQTYKDFFNAANMMNEKDVPIRRAVTRALRSVLTTQAGKPAPDMGIVHKVAELLVSIIDNDPAAPVKESAIYAIGYLYPPKFTVEQKEPALAIIFLMDKKDTTAELKALMPDALEAITGVNFGLDVARWKDWAQKKWPGSRL